MKRLLLLSAIMAWGLSGCASIEPGTPPVSAVDAHTLGLGDDATMAWPSTQWWHRYGDPQLNTLMNEALANSPSMHAAQARLALANAAVGSAGARLLPSANADYALTRERLSENYLYPPPLGGAIMNDKRLALDFSYELDLWGKNRSRLDAALSQQRAASAETHTAANLLANATVLAYLNLQNAFAQHDVLQRVMTQRSEALNLTQSRYAAGLDTLVDVKQAESVLAASQVEATQNDTTLARLRNQVAALVGAGPQRGQLLQSVSLTAPAGVLPTRLPLALLGHRPDVVAARWRAEAAGYAVDAAKAEFYPNINLAAFVGFQALGAATLIDASSHMVGIGPAISLPIFHGGALNANLSGRRAEADLAVSDYNQTVIDAVHQVADILAGLRLLEQERAQQRVALQAVNQAYTLALQRYKAGLGNYLAVLAAQTGVLTQARLAADLHIRAYQLDASLAYALGGGYSAAPSFVAPTSH